MYRIYRIFLYDWKDLSLTIDGGWFYRNNYGRIELVTGVSIDGPRCIIFLLS